MAETQRDMIMALDIETIPDPDKLDCLPVVEAPGNYKDPFKIEEYKREKYSANVEKMALDPYYGKIAAYAIVTRIEGQNAKVYADVGLPEDALLGFLTQHFIETYHDCKTIVTYNGAAFDIPYIRTRLLMNRMTPLPIVPTGKYRCSGPHERHCDLYQMLADEQNPLGRSMKLNDYAKLIGIPARPEPDVAKTGIAEAIKSPKGREAVLRMCVQDARTTLDVYQTIAKYY